MEDYGEDINVSPASTLYGAVLQFRARLNSICICSADGRSCTYNLQLDGTHHATEALQYQWMFLHHT